MDSILSQRSENTCELCQANTPLQAYQLPFSPDNSADSHVAVCEVCMTSISTTDDIDYAHLRCLSNSMWSQVPAVQVLSYQLLHKCNSQAWAQDALDMLYLEDDVLQWAKAGVENQTQVTVDVNGVTLQAGDAVTIIKDLDVKGAGFTAKRGTPVRNIGLSENPLHIEGKVNGQRIVIIAAYTKKN